MEMSRVLHEALGDAQRLGFLGARPIDEVIEHARRFVDALGSVDGSIVDLGAGGGVPGLVIAHDRPDLRVTLIDRRTKRTDFLERVVGRLGWADRVEVIAADAERVAIEQPPGFDAAVARGFGPPEKTLDLAIRLVRPGGTIVISEPPEGDRWVDVSLVRSGVVDRGTGVSGVATFTVRG
jgi:16S rRNA (guanine527-N7)-methyltransferase